MRNIRQTLPRIALLGAIALFASPIHAQTVGTYSGLQANGQPVSLLVSRYKGQLIVEAVTVQVNTTCKDGTNLIVDGGYGTVGPIVNGSGQYAFGYAYYYSNLSFTFDNATHTVSGYVTQTYSIFAPPSSPSAPPEKSTFCTSGNQAYAAVLGKTANFDPKAKVVTFHRPN